MLNKLWTYKLEDDFLHLKHIIRHYKERSIEDMLPYFRITSKRPPSVNGKMELRTWHILLQYWTGRSKLLK